MKQYAYTITLSVTAALFGLTACGDSDSSPSTPKDEPEAVVSMDSVKTNDDLPNCTEKRQEMVAFIEDNSSIRICLDEKWETAESVAATKEELPSCSQKREASTAYVMDDHSYYTCTDERWQKGLTEPESSSSKKVDSSSSSKKEEKNSSSSEKGTSSEDNKSSSSSNDPKSSSAEKSSSSTKPEESSSSKEVKPAKASLTATIYDTDKTLNPVFTEDGVDDTGYGACIGVQQGLVKESLDASGKPAYSGSAAAKICFEKESNFNTLFNYTPGINEVVAWEMPFAKNEDGLWGFDSDTMLNGENYGGFFPIENTTDNDVITLNGVKLGPTPIARTLRNGQAPYFRNDSIEFYHYCNTPGWAEGNDCNNLFDHLNNPTNDFWDWTSPRNLSTESHWSGNRNHHFCMEIHGTFTYSDSLEAGFSASGDQWVFIGNKLAVDNGGAHVNAPGFVQLKTLNKTYGSYMKEGKEYPINIFYCARRTSLSDFSIWTNFAITQE